MSPCTTASTCIKLEAVQDVGVNEIARVVGDIQLKVDVEVRVIRGIRVRKSTKPLARTKLQEL